MSMVLIVDCDLRYRWSRGEFSGLESVRHECRDQYGATDDVPDAGGDDVPKQGGGPTRTIALSRSEGEEAHVGRTVLEVRRHERCHREKDGNVLAEDGSTHHCEEGCHPHEPVGENSGDDEHGPAMDTPDLPVTHLRCDDIPDQRLHCGRVVLGVADEIRDDKRPEEVAEPGKPPEAENPPPGGCVSDCGCRHGDVCLGEEHRMRQDHEEEPSREPETLKQPGETFIGGASGEENREKCPNRDEPSRENRKKEDPHGIHVAESLAPFGGHDSHNPFGGDVDRWRHERKFVVSLMAIRVEVIRVSLHG